MKLNYDEFSLRFLRPAIFNGEELELEVKFEDASLYHVNIDKAKVLEMPVGDTGCIRGFVCFAEKENKSLNHHKYLVMYMDGEELTSFINKFEIRNINETVKVRVKHIYAVLEKENYTGTEYEEIIGFKLLKLI